jgi:hypothetical protein
MVMIWLIAYAAAQRGDASGLLSVGFFTERGLPAASPFDGSGQIKTPELCSCFFGDNSCLI